MSSDAFHMTLPDETGESQARAMQHGHATRPGSSPADVDYINAHGTSTPPGDIAETTAIKIALGEHARKVADLLDQVDDRPLPGRLGRHRSGRLRC